MQLQHFESEQQWLEALVEELVSRIQQKSEEGAVFRLAVSGGSTPAPLYKALANESRLDWSRVEVYLVDERYVSYEDDYSNHRFIDETLLKDLPQKPAKEVFFNTSVSREESLEEYEAQLNTGENPFFDLILLGMGADGHTASLFPEDELLSEEKRWVGSSKKGNPVSERLTLSYPALESSSAIFFLLKGASKKEVLEKALKTNHKDSSLPAARLLHRESTEVWSC